MKLATIAQKLEHIRDELEQIAIDAEDIGMTGASHKIQSALGNLSSAQLAAQQWREF